MEGLIFVLYADEIIFKLDYSVLSHPGIPPDSMWFAIVTASDHTSYCHFRSPITPDKTVPVLTPIRMFTLTPVASRTCLLVIK